VREGTYASWLSFATDESSRRGVTGTPTIFVNDRKVTPAQGQTITDAGFNTIAAQSYYGITDLGLARAAMRTRQPQIA
jgi:Mlc titration factor MtfA (ptsG expression regulator)